MLPSSRFVVLNNLRPLPTDTFNTLPEEGESDEVNESVNVSTTEEAFVVGYGGCVGVVGRKSRRQVWVGERDEEVRGRWTFVAMLVIKSDGRD